MQLSTLFRRKPAAERRVYEAIVAAARQPRPYAEWGVPDSIDGRFDMIGLHLFLVLDRLRGQEAVFRQRLTDAFFADMDRSLREMGVGDLSVAKKIRKMAEAFFGRVAAYDAALPKGREAFAAVLVRNVYAGNGDAGRLAAYALTVRDSLLGQQPGQIAAGHVNFPEA